MLTLSGVLDAGLKILQGDWSGAWESMRRTARQFIDNVLRWLGTDFETFSEQWKGIWENALTIVTKTLENIVLKVVEWGQKLTDKIWEIVDALFNPFETLGENIGNSITGWMEQAGEDIAEFFGIRSPSKLFEEYGRDIVAGLQKGLEGGGSLMVTAAPAAGGQSTTNNFTLNVNTSAPAEPIAQDFEMMKALARRR
jgi:hypothetical protein